MTMTKRTYYTVDTEQENYWLRKALEAGSTRLTGQDDWYRIHFPTKDAAEEFVRDVFADYCEDVVNAYYSNIINNDDRIKASEETGLSLHFMRERAVYRSRFVRDGTSIEVEDWDKMTMTRKVEVQVVNTVTERREVVVDSETYSKEVKREVASSWYEAYPEIVRVQVNAVELYAVREEP
jgi:hypothetical protein